MLKIYNSLTQTKDEFKSIKVGEISLYVCGMTVYDHCHIGHGIIEHSTRSSEYGDHGHTISTSI